MAILFIYVTHFLSQCTETTSVQILSTELKLQHGNITYHFKEGDIGVRNPSNQSSIRTKIGVCPQHNSSLANDLTCRETLRLFAYLKGGILIQQGESIDEAVESEVERRLEDVKFTSEEDADKLVSTYSGGMQRKVLIALALLGDPQVVFLDGKLPYFCPLFDGQLQYCFFQSEQDFLTFLSSITTARTHGWFRSIQSSHNLGYDYCCKKGSVDHINDTLS